MDQPTPTHQILDYTDLSNRFKQRLVQLRSELSSPVAAWSNQTLQLNIRRSDILEDTYQQRQRRSGSQIRDRKLLIRFFFEDVNAADEDWVVNECLSALVEEIFRAEYCLFRPCDTYSERLLYEPNPASHVNPEHLSYFESVGRILGKAVVDGRTVGISLPRSVYLHLLDQTVDYHDIEWIDTKLFADLCWILENDPASRNLTFTVEDTQLGESVEFELIIDGTTIHVTEDNKREYVELYARYRLVDSVNAQLEAFESGFYEIVPKDLISAYTVEELELLISGRTVG